MNAVTVYSRVLTLGLSDLIVRFADYSGYRSPRSILGLDSTLRCYKRDIPLLSFFVHRIIYGSFVLLLLLNVQIIAVKKSARWNL